MEGGTVINLSAVNDLWDFRGVVLFQELNDLELDDSPHTSATDKAAARSQKAEVSRKLLELADLCAMMETVVRNEYWIYKGSGVDLEIGFYDE
jgi:hypothetical protein